MGAGKSTVGRILARKLHWKFIDLDEEIERRAGRSIADIFREHGESHFRNLERLCLEDMSSKPKTVFALGGGAFVDPDNRTLTEKSGLTVWLKVSLRNLEERVKIDGTRPNFADRTQVERLYQAREPFYTLARIHVSTDDGTPESAADEIMGVIEKL